MALRLDRPLEVVAILSCSLVAVDVIILRFRCLAFTSGVTCFHESPFDLFTSGATGNRKERRRFDDDENGSSMEPSDFGPTFEVSSSAGIQSFAWLNDLMDNNRTGFQYAA